MFWKNYIIFFHVSFAAFAASCSLNSCIPTEVIQREGITLITPSISAPIVISLDRDLGSIKFYYLCIHFCLKDEQNKFFY